MILRPTRSTRTATRFPYTTPFRSIGGLHRGAAPEPEAHRRVAVAGDVVGDALLLPQRGDSLGRGGLRVLVEGSEPGIDDLQADRGAGARLRPLGQAGGPARGGRPLGPGRGGFF